MKKVLAGLLLFLAVSPIAANAEVQFIVGKAQRCDNACERAGLTAIESGTYKPNGETFFVCGANGGKAQGRAGYNLSPDWDNVCVVGYGGKEVRVSKYNCLCE